MKYSILTQCFLKQAGAIVKIQSLNKVLGLLFLMLLMTSCGQKSDVENANGTVNVDVPIQKNSDSFVFKTIQLFGIDSLKDVSGKFVHFFYSPGAEGSKIYGETPKARFAKKGNRFIPMDAITNQMSVIYYHLQNMAQLDELSGAAGVNHWPRIVGLDTILANVPEGSRSNNAFYDGFTDSMMFLPYTADQLPIAVNGGVIAHEHFHSLYYKLVIKTALKNRNLNLLPKQTASAHPLKIESESSIKFNDEKISLPSLMLSNSDRVDLVNKAYLMGINEGLADFWAWVYSDDANYIQWSLPTEKLNRSLELNADEIGNFKKDKDIDAYVRYLFTNHTNANEYLTGYYYEIGTPHAKFLRQFSLLLAEQQSKPLSEVKIQVAGKVIKFLKSFALQIQQLKVGETLKADSLFTYFSKDSSLAGTKVCDLVLKYTLQSACTSENLP